MCEYSEKYKTMGEYWEKYRTGESWGIGGNDDNFGVLVNAAPHHNSAIAGRHPSLVSVDHPVDPARNCLDDTVGRHLVQLDVSTLSLVFRISGRGKRDEINLFEFARPK